MKFEKKLKNLIEENGEELRSKNDSFYQQMSLRYAEIEAEQAAKTTEKKAKPFWQSARFLSAAAACLVLTLTLAIGIPIWANKDTTSRNQTLDNSVPVISDSTDNKGSVTAPDFRFNFKADLKMVESEGIFHISGKSLGFEKYDINENTEMKNTDGEIVGSYVFGNGGSNWFQVLLLTDSSFSYESKLASDSTEITVEDLKINFSVAGSESGMTYIYGEAESDGDRLVIEFMTTASDALGSFNTFLSNIIR